MKALYQIFCLASCLFCVGQTIQIQSFATGFSNPLEIVHAGDSRLFVVEKAGKIKILNSNGTTNSVAFLDLSAKVTTNSERGLLGLAFHPNYATNGWFFINYTDLNGNTVIARYSVSATNSNIASTNETILLTINQPFSNHNGGSIKFGPDGFLYIGMGDGGSSGDPSNRAQNTTDNLGKMLRINVNATAAPFYTIPPSNPYVGIAGNDEIWAIGLRNPWKFSFNRISGDLWIADVGQNAFEEVNRINAPLQSGLNFGWRCYEGNAAYNTSGCAAQNTMYAPIIAIDHATACSITGGYVYTGSVYPNLTNKYLFVDFCDSKMGIINQNGILTYSATLPVSNIATFGEDNLGELYVAGLYNGTIYKIIDTSLFLNKNEKGAFKMYPNPAKNELIIETEEAIGKEITIYNLIGQELHKQTLEAISKNIISTRTMSKGTYLVTIRSIFDTYATQKLVIE